MPITGGYTLNHGDRYAGMVVDAQVNNSVSKLNGTGAVIPWGRFVARDGATKFKAVGIGTTAADIIGVLRRELNRAQADGDADGAPDERDATILTTGTIYMQTLGAVTAGGAVYAVVGASGEPDTPAANPGIASAAAGSGATTAVAITGAKFLETTSAAGVVAVSLVIGG